MPTLSDTGSIWQAGPEAGAVSYPSVYGPSRFVGGGGSAYSRMTRPQYGCAPLCTALRCSLYLSRQAGACFMQMHRVRPACVSSTLVFDIGSPDGTYLGVQERGGILALGAARGAPRSASPVISVHAGAKQQNLQTSTLLGAILLCHWHLPHQLHGHGCDS